MKHFYALLFSLLFSASAFAQANNDATSFTAGQVTCYGNANGDLKPCAAVTGGGSLTTLSGTFAAIPSASSNTGVLYFDTDWNVVLISDGTKWKPVGGCAVIYQSGVLNSVTGGTANTEYNTGAIATIPANLLSANGRLYITDQWVFPSNSDTKTVIVRVSTTSGDTSGGTVYFTDSETTKTQSNWVTTIQNANSQSTQKGFANGSVGTASSGSAIGSSIATGTTQWYVNFNANNVTSNTDTTSLTFAQVQWCDY